MVVSPMFIKAAAALLTSDKTTAPIALDQLAAGSNANLAKATLSSVTPVSASMLSAMRQLDHRTGAAYGSGNSPREAGNSKLPKRRKEGATRHTTAPGSGAA